MIKIRSSKFWDRIRSILKWVAMMYVVIGIFLIWYSKAYIVAIDYLVLLRIFIIIALVNAIGLFLQVHYTGRAYGNMGVGFKGVGGETIAIVLCIVNILILISLFNFNLVLIYIAVGLIIISPLIAYIAKQLTDSDKGGKT